MSLSRDKGILYIYSMYIYIFVDLYIHTYTRARAHAHTQHSDPLTPQPPTQGGCSRVGWAPARQALAKAPQDGFGIWESQKNGAHTSSVPTEVLLLSMAALPGTASAGSSTEGKSTALQARCLQDIPCMMVNSETHFPNWLGAQECCDLGGETCLSNSQS